MKAKINFITIAASDLAKCIDFYQNGLGFPTQGIQVGHEHCLFELEDDFLLVVYSRKEFLQQTAKPDQ